MENAIVPLGHHSYCSWVCLCVCVCVCGSVMSHLTSGVSVCPENTVTWSKSSIIGRCVLSDAFVALVDKLGGHFDLK